MLTRIAAGLGGGEKSPFDRNAEVVRERRQSYLLQDEAAFVLRDLSQYSQYLYIYVTLH